MSFAEQLKSSVDIVDVVGQYVRLRKAGPRWVGLCPFHTEKTPSFSVHGALQFYKCFGCGAGGDVIKFVMEIEALTFFEAITMLAERYGIPVPKRAAASDPDTQLRAALFRMHELARDLYVHALGTPAGAEARAYLERRGMVPGSIQEFQLGLADRSGQALTRIFEREGFTPEQMEASGLVLRREQSPGFFDRFRGRLMFPIQDESGRIIAFGGRALEAEQQPKYLNSSGTRIYEKSRVLYNLNRAKQAIRKGERVVLVEGYMDAIGVWSAGVQEVVAPCGTSLTSEQVRALRRHAPSVVLNLDSDQAGAKATEGHLQMLLEEGMRVRVLQVQGGKDPDEFIREHGPERYRECLEKAPGYFYWLADRARSRFDMRTSDGRVSALQFLLPAIKLVSDKLERATIASEVATHMGIEPGLVLDHFRKAATDRKERPLQIEAPVPPIESLLLHLVLVDRGARQEILPALRNLPYLERFATRRIFQALLAMTEFSFAELEGRLEEPDRNLVHAVVFADREYEGEDQALEQARECLRRLERDQREARRHELKSLAKEAERAGKLREALQYAEELNALDRG